MDPNQYNPQPGPPPPGYPQQPGSYQPMPNQQPVPSGPAGSYPPQQPAYGQQYLQQPPYSTGPTGPGMPPGGMQPQQPVQQSPMLGYNPYPYPGEFDGSGAKRSPSKLIIGAFVVVILVVVIFAVLASSNNSGTGQNNQNQNTNTNTQQQSSDSGKDVVPRSDGKLDLSSKIKTSSTLKQQTVQGNMNEQINLSSGFSFMATKAAVYTSPNKDTLPADGKKFIVVTVVVGNRADGSNLSVSYLDFRLRDSDNILIAGSTTTNEILNNSLSSPTELKPGEQLTGKIVFEVAKNDSSWVLKHSETYQKTTDNTTFNVEGEIVIKLAATTDTSTDSTTNSTTGTSTDTDTSNSDQSTTGQ